MKYPIAIEPGNKTSAWGVVVPDLPGCFSAGDTLDEVYAMAREAIGLWINTALDDNQPIPVPAAMETHVRNPDFSGWMWGIIDIDTDDFSDAIDRINITMPRRVLRQIDLYVEKHHANRSRFLVAAALKAVYESGSDSTACE